MARKASKEYNLLVLKPELCEEWDYEKNELGSENYTPSSTKIVWWKCKRGHEWEQSPNRRSKNCPYCCHRRACKDNCLATMNPKLAKEWHPVKNGILTPYDVLPRSGKKVWWFCGKHEWEETIDNRSKDSMCPYCIGRRASNEHNLSNVPSLFNEWNYEKNGKLTPYDVTPHSGKSVWWKCKNGHEWEAVINDRIKNGHEWEAVINDRIKNGCPYCSNKKVCEDNCLEKTHPELCEEWDYEKNIITPKDVTFGSSREVWWKCKNGHECKLPICKRTSRGCSRCNHTVSKVGMRWLDELGISDREKSVNCGDRRFLVDEMYLNTIYEFLGDYWHGNPCNFNPHKINKNTKISFGDLLYKTIEKLNCLYINNYSIIYRWEFDSCDFNYKFINKDKEQILKTAEEIFQKQKTCNILEVLS